MNIKKNKELHVDDFVKYGLNKGDKNEMYARWVLFHLRLDHVYKVVFNDIMQTHKLFCTFDNKRYKVVGATWSGKIWLSLDIKGQGKYRGYNVAVYPMECKDWSET